MSAMLRQWKGSSFEVPTNNGAGMSASMVAGSMTEEEVENMIDFIKLAQEAFGREQEYWRLWGALNMILCMWLYRRLVLLPPTKLTRSVKITQDQFKRCLMSLSADSHYLDWLVGRFLSERDRRPAYDKIKSIFAQRLYADTKAKATLPQPAWGGR